jgi:hypothetical protein
MSEFPTTENGISMLVNAEWHADQCRVNETRKYMDCDCSLSRAIAATEQEAIRRAEEGPAVSEARADLLVFLSDYIHDAPHRREARRLVDRAIESRSETVRRMQREGGGEVTAVRVSRVGETPA